MGNFIFLLVVYYLSGFCVFLKIMVDEVMYVYKNNTKVDVNKFETESEEILTSCINEHGKKGAITNAIINMTKWPILLKPFRIYAREMAGTLVK